MKSIEKPLLKLERSLETTSNTMKIWKKQQFVLTFLNVSVLAVIVTLIISHNFK